MKGAASRKRKAEAVPEFEALKEAKRVAKEAEKAVRRAAKGLEKAEQKYAKALEKREKQIEREKARAQAAAAKEAAREEKAKKKKKKRDPNAPKRPMSAYIFFLERHREATKLENPNLDITQIMSILAGKWAKVTAKEKAICVAAAAKDRERYEKAKAEYVPPPASPSKVSKRAPSAFVLFSKEFWAKLKAQGTSADKDFVEESRKVAAMWKNMSAADREKYEVESAKLKEEAAIKAAEAKAVLEARAEEANRIKAAKKAAQRAKAAAKPKKSGVAKKPKAAAKPAARGKGAAAAKATGDALQRVKDCLKGRVKSPDDAYYQLVAARQNDIAGFNKGVKDFIGDGGKKADVKGFLVHCLGYDSAVAHFK
eukprot:PRCOL_00005228-RA